MNLQVFKFDTIVQENGIIRIPEIKRFVNCEIEIFVVIKQTKKLEPKLTVSSFIEQWAGFFKTNDADDAKYQYLTEKYKW